MEKSYIKIAAKEDIPALVTLINSAYRGDSARKGWTHEADLLDGQRVDEEGLTEIINNNCNRFIKYSEDNIIKACMLLEKRDNHLYLGMLTVNPALQGKGIGKLLLKEAEVHALELNCAVIEMTVITLRKELITWYERHGYRNTGIIKPFPAGDPRFGIPNRHLEFTVMEKELN